MFKTPPGSEIAVRTQLRKELLESRLVLDTAGIPAETVSQDGWWFLLVDSENLAVSLEELEAYRQENPQSPPRTDEPAPIYGGAAMGVVAYSIIVVGIALLAGQSAYGVDWQQVGQMQAGLVLDGEWWRIVTALTLHADTGHIAGNLLFGTIFGYLAGQVLGGGVAWLVIVSAGTLGNLVNALVQNPTHTSIGASTAVFAALGVIVAHALRPRRSTEESMLKRWSPLVGGVLLLAFIGVGGERTDVMAHVTGFLAGLLVGWLGCGLPGKWLASDRVQTVAALASIAIVALAWWIGIVAD